jgi:polyhydroxyalkanoate synthesis regulator phasin
MTKQISTLDSLAVLEQRKAYTAARLVASGAMTAEEARKLIDRYDRARAELDTKGESDDRVVGEVYNRHGLVM